MTHFIYHITSQTEWSDAQKQGTYSPNSLRSNGFIHCSKLDQILRVANSFFIYQHGLVILVIDPSELGTNLRWEAGADKVDEYFPHIYGPLNSDAVLEVIEFEPGVDGRFLLPQSLTAFHNDPL